MLQLKCWVPGEGEVVQDFTMNEIELAVHMGKVYLQRGWNPRLLSKTYDGRFSWLTSYLSQRLAA